MKQHHLTLSIGTLFLLIASWFGITQLHDDPLYFDETITIFEIGNPYGYNNLAGVIDAMQVYSKVLPPGYHLQLSLWVRFSGYSQVGLRAYSVFIGLIALAMLYRLAKDYANRDIALLTMGLASVNMLYLFYFHEIRMYTVAMLMLTIFLWAYLRVFPKDRNLSRWDWGLLWLSTVLLLYTHYFSIFTIFAVCLFHLLFVGKNQRWWIVVGTLGLAGLAFLPWIGVTLQGASSEIQPSLQGSAIETTWFLLMVLGNGNPILAIGALVGIIVGCLTTTGNKRYLVWVALISWVVFIGVQQYRRIMPDYRIRYLLLFYPSILVLISAAITRFIHPLWGRLGLIAVWLITGIIFLPSDTFYAYTNREDSRAEYYPPYPQMLNVFYGEQMPSADDIILSMATYENVFGMEYANEFYSLRLGTPMLSMLPSTWETALPTTFPNLDTAPSIWWATIADPDFATVIADVEAYIERNHKVCDTYTLNNGRALIRYGIATLPCDWYNDNSTTISYAEEDIELQTTQATITDSVITIGTAWDVGDTVRLHQYSVALRVYDAEGNFVTDTNFPLPYGRLAQHIAQIPLNETDSATYEVRVIVYDWQTGDTLTANTTNSEIAPLLILSAN